ncbi:MAG: histidine kinase [Candidatus Thiodiazotropha sp. (ex Dulcina madagascariensis)]|nr:histidine kinase [Candidatus Thiodiazotropha sp. (ex Dulcina madagascariensis)]
MGLRRALSIHQRLLLAASLVLSAFLGLTGLALDKAFRSASEDALQARLFSSVYALLAAAEEGEKGQLRMPEVLTDPRFNRPDSGLYAQVSGITGQYRWRSGSSLGRSLDFSRNMSPGESKIERFKLADGEAMGLSFGVVWEDFDGRELKYVLAVAEDLRPLQEQIATFRDTLFLWLGSAALLLLLVQGWVLSWGLQPLRQVEQALTEIESGQANQLQGDYPKELNRLTSNINSLIRHAQARQQRYRDSLGDLAHSLKTPLAILQGIVDRGGDDPETSQRTVREQVERMNQIVSHQLQRAAASGRTILTQGLPVNPLVERLVKSLDKVYIEKGIQWQRSIAPESRFRGDEGDLMELLGNLMENACKYGAGRVRVSAQMEDCLHLCVEDDGKGIPDEEAEAVLQRGHRADQHQPGQGIGLAVAADIVSAYGGTLQIRRSDRLGGAAIQVWLPIG